MKALPVIFLLFAALDVFGQECRKMESLRDTFSLCWNSEHKAWITKGCFTKQCEALQYLKNPRRIKLSSHEGFVQNPASRLCKELKLEVEILRDEYGDEQSFCVFGDKSMVDSNAVEMLNP